MNTNKEGRIFIIADYIWNVLFRWKACLVAAILCGAILGGVKYMRDLRQYQADLEAASVEKTVEEFDVEEALGKLSYADRLAVRSLISQVDLLMEQQDYKENSAMMQVNPYKEWLTTIKYAVRGNEEVAAICQMYQDALYDTDAIKRIVEASDGTMKASDVSDMVVMTAELYGTGTETGSDDETEVVAAVGTQNSYMFTINIKEYDKDALEKVSKVVETLIDEEHSVVTQALGSHVLQQLSYYTTEGFDLKSVNRHKAVNLDMYNISSRMNTLMNNMTDAQKNIVNKYIRSKSQSAEEKAEAATAAAEKAAKKKDSITKPKINKLWIVLGAVLGIILVAGIEFLRWLLGGRINSIEELTANTDRNIIGMITSEENKKKGLDKVLGNLRERSQSSRAAYDRPEMIAKNLLLLAGKNQTSKLFINLKDVGEGAEAALWSIKEKLAASGVELILGQDVLGNPEEMQRMADCGFAVLAENIRKASYPEMEEEDRFLKLFGVKQLGTILVR